MKNNQTNSTTGNKNKLTKKKVLIISGITILLLLTSVTYYRYFFVFGEGVKAGQLNYFVEKGYLFKTNEGRLILAGLRTDNPGSVSSNEFMFSVSDRKIADTLNHHAGAFFQLHYKEYLHPLAWRGVSRYVVDSIYTIKPGFTN